MSESKPNRARPRRSLLARLGASKDGIAAVEFAYLAPVMLLIFVGAFEVSRAIGVDRRFSIITSMTGDLVAREEIVDDAKLGGVMQVIEHVMKPYDPSSLKIGVISVQLENNVPKVKWAYAHNGASVPPKCSQMSTDDLPPGLLGDNGSVILVKSSYTYEPFFVNYDELMVAFKENGSWKEWKEKSTHSPRVAQCVGDAANPKCAFCD
jgi:Flp pilus assembly protein TadG